MRHTRLLTVLLPLALACSGNPAPEGTPSAAPRYDRSLISAAEVDQARERSVATAYDLVRQLRPHWMGSSQSTISGGSGQIVVFMDRQRLGGVESLRQVSLTQVASLRYLSPSEAGAMFGADVNYGAIDVIRR